MKMKYQNQQKRVVNHEDAAIEKPSIKRSAEHEEDKGNRYNPIK